MNAVMSQWTKFIVCFIFVSAAVLVQSLNRLPICTNIRVSSSMYHEEKNGLYEMLSNDSCGGRPAYIQFGSSNYIYYSDAGWEIGSTRCVNVGRIRANSTARYPDRVTTTWEELAYESTWESNPYRPIHVNCYDFAPCGYIKVSNSSYHPHFHGIYEMMPSSDGCDGRPAYRLRDSCVYIYYSRSTKSWLIGARRCGLSAGIAAVSTEIAPDKVISTWEEVSSKADMYGYSIGKEAGNKIWIPTQSLSVSCFDPRQNDLITERKQTTTPDGNVCSHIRVTNSKHQLNRHGLYVKMSSNYSCGGRPEYIQFGSSNYIYYFGFGWCIGPRGYGNAVGITATSTARYPDRVTTTWEEFVKEDTPGRKLVNGGDKGSWMPSPSIDVTCYNFAPCGFLEVSKPSYHHDYSGIYEMLSSSDGCYGYPAYKRKGSSKYIYYNSRGIWEFGEKRCGIYVAIKAVSTEVSPDKVTATWEEYVHEVLKRNGVIVEELGDKWISDYSLSVSCYDPRQKSSSTTKNPDRKETSGGFRTYAWFLLVVAVASFAPIALGV